MRSDPSLPQWGRPSTLGRPPQCLTTSKFGKQRRAPAAATQRLQNNPSTSAPSDERADSWPRRLDLYGTSTGPRGRAPFPPVKRPLSATGPGHEETRAIWHGFQFGRFCVGEKPAAYRRQPSPEAAATSGVRRLHHHGRRLHHHGRRHHHRHRHGPHEDALR